MHEAAKYISRFTGTYLLAFTVGCNVPSEHDDGLHLRPRGRLRRPLQPSRDRHSAARRQDEQLGPASRQKIRAGCSYFALFRKVFNLAPVAGFGWWEVMLVEVLCTSMLCFVLLNVAATRPLWATSITCWPSVS